MDDQAKPEREPCGNRRPHIATDRITCKLPAGHDGAHASHPGMIWYPVDLDWQNLSDLIDETEVELTTTKAELEQLRARLAEIGALTHVKTEWSTDNTFGPAEDSITNEKLAFGRVSHRPDIHKQVVNRKVYAAGGVVGPGAGPVLESGCTYTLPSRAEVEADGRIQLRMRTPEESRAYLIEQRDAQIATGMPTEVIDAMIAATYDSEERQ